MGDLRQGVYRPQPCCAYLFLGGNRWGCPEGYLTLCKSSTCLSAWGISAQRTGCCSSPSSPSPPASCRQGHLGINKAVAHMAPGGLGTLWGSPQTSHFSEHTLQPALRQWGLTSFGMLASCSGSLHFPSDSKSCARVHTLESQAFVSLPCGKAENLDNGREVCRACCCTAGFAVKICLWSLISSPGISCHYLETLEVLSCSLLITFERLMREDL